jgi:hypothetical protein
MTLSQEYLSAVSATIIFGQDQKVTMFNYYYYSGLTFTTKPPTGVTAILKNNGNIVATLPGYQISLSINGVKFLFYDTSENTYSFDEVDIYTEINGTLQYLVSRNTGLNYSKSATEAVTIYYTLELQSTPSIFINYAFLFLLVPKLSLYNIFPFTNYVGITLFTVSGVSGTVSLVGTGLIPNGFEILLQLTTTGNGVPTISALTAVETTLQGVPFPISIGSQQVFSATLNVQLPQTSQPVTYPIVIGLTYEVTS